MLRVQMWRRRDGWSTPTSLRWRSLDSTIASVDSLGVVTPRAIGRVTIEASLSGWRAAHRELVVSPNKSVTLIDELWHDGVTKAWRGFGDPKPRIVRTSEGDALSNNGDGNYASGAYSQNEFDLRGGLVVDVRMSTPINASQWQTQFVQLLGGQRDEALALWDHTTGYYWSDARNWTSSCGVAAPGGPEGATNADNIGLATGNVGGQIPMRSNWRSGAWYTLRLQIFPDGRCGIAIDGTPLAIGQMPDGVRNARLAMWGNSVGTTMAIGRVRIRTGVAPDVDWKQIPL